MRRLSAALLLVLTLGLGVSPAPLWADDMASANGAATGESLSASTQLGAAGDALAAADPTADVAAPSDDAAADGEYLAPDEQPDTTPAPDAGAAVQRVEVLDYTGIELSEERIVLGQTVVVTPQVSGMDEADLRFNYVWNYEGAWKDWSSTVKETGSQTADATWEFTPSRVGRYEIYIDVVQPDGTTLTKTTTLTVLQNWAVGDLVVTVGDDAYEAAVPLGESVNLACAMADGSVLQGLTYNFGWRFGDGWNEWDSIMKSGAASSTNAWTFTPAKAGTYHLFADVMGPDGSKETVEKTVVVGLAYAATGVELSAESIEFGSSVVVSPVLPASLDGLTFNYVWCLNGGWDVWSSTVKEKGEETSESTWTFTPPQRGTYVLYVDVVGPDGTRQTLSTNLNVNNGWDFSGVSLDKPSPQTVRTPITVRPNVTGERCDVLEFNYVWVRDNWAEWSSTVKETGARTTETSFTFTPTKSGAYTFYIDVVDTRTGETVTKQATLQVNARWTLKGLDLSYASPMRPYAQVTMRPILEGDTSGLTFNYVWQGDNWYVWDSDLKNGGYTTAASKTVTIGNGGIYSFYVDVVDQYGEKQTAQVLNIRARYAADIINRIEGSLASQSPYNGSKFENALMAAGGTLCNNRRGWWCATYLWWGFQQNNALDLWGTSGMQADPEWLANEFRALGRFHNGTSGVQRGDILFSYWAPWRGGQWITHASYVTNVTASTVTVLEGNMGYSSVWHTYSLWDSHFRGHARPAY